MARRRRAMHWASLGALPLAIAAGAVLLVCGAFLPARVASARQVGPWVLLVAAGLFAAARQLRLALRGTGLVRSRDRSAAGLHRAPRSWSVEAAALLAVGTLALIQLTGGAQSPLGPFIYLLGAGYVLALPLPIACALVCALLGFDTALLLSSPGPLSQALRERWPIVASHAGFTVLFASLYHALLAARLHRSQRAEREAVGRRIAEAEERARELRLVATADAGAAEDEAGPDAARERHMLSAVAEVEEALRGALAVAEAALRPHTVAVFLIGPDGESVRLRECLSKSDKLFRGPLPRSEGAIGAVLASARPVRLSGDGPALAYYEGRAPAQSFCGVPLRERRLDLRAEAVTAPQSAEETGPATRDGAVLGALIADRDAPFSSDDERVLTALAAEVVRAIEAERLLSAVRREKEEKARFFRALEDLNRTRAVGEAATMAVAHARRMCPGLDLCAVTLAEEPRIEEGGPTGKRSPRPRLRHCVAAAAGEGSSALEGLSFADNAGLVSNVVRLGAPLPGRELGAMDRVVIFDGKTSVRGLSALKIFPLRAGEITLGTLVCGSRNRYGLPAASQLELARLGLQAAEALARTRLFEQAERLATTDGLTGLVNRRTMNAQLAARMREAQRYRHCLSFLLLDIDHFKRVNDTHGHPAGDAVLRGVAAVAQSQARETDVVARYGGEEIALILPETDAAGAWVIAERLRAAIESEEHATESGILRCTASIGVATWPSAEPSAARQAAGLSGADPLTAALIADADKALYRAKQSGRNRVESALGQFAA